LNFTILPHHKQLQSRYSSVDGVMHHNYGLTLVYGPSTVPVLLHQVPHYGLWTH